MVRLELDQVVMRRMKEDDIEMVKALIKEGCEGTENRLILHILTRPLCLFILAVFSSILRCLVHSFILALAIPVFLLIIFLKLTMPRSTGVLGSSRPYWDYVGSSYRGTQDQTLLNPYCRISGKTPVTKKPRRRITPKDKDKEPSTENVTPEREQEAGQVWVADCDGEILGCIFRESEKHADIRRICRLVTGSWYRREGLGRLLVQSLEHRETEAGAHRVFTHVPYPSKLGETFFRKLGYRQIGEGTDEEEEDDEERKLESPERGLLGYPLTKVFFKDM
ncbi:putative N-acetyltransferase 14 [Cottoperca gobio]|uniref:Probable N-acetyltransferase 14 n=1 Tax=Cottoperca gobio TaxID=56716 RepID=A0A6J2RBC5_COTGO|nr:N-acetyltransferase 14 [Cottoperca gobio]XP_029307594.1 N-acetyltransferase 14 [Cottoperca gobio]XP_029307595.1 N-acetyltransferase 14 [Cottoperca gobio]XP_029307596.1 N-acetyltransferase 14 [Cottoperca gobio]